MSDYPILVEKLTAEQAMRIRCETCGAEKDITDDEILNDAVYACPKRCGGSAVYKYEWADKCGGCGKLGFYEKVLDGCCSRVCQLQAEYKRELEARKSAA